MRFAISRRSWLRLAVALPMLVCSGACSVSPKGALMLAISTDLQTPKDIDVVSVFIETDGVPKFDYLGRVLPDGTLSLPSTLAIAEPDASSAHVRVRVIAFQSHGTGDATGRILRDVVTTVPHGRTALLRVPLNFVDDGSAMGTLPGNLVPGAGGAPEGSTSFDPLQIGSPCDFTKGLTSTNGTCVSATVDPSSLPSYDATQVYGEAGVTPIGTPAACFDVTTCLAHASPVTGFDPSTCAFSAPAPFDATTFEVALVTPDTGWCLAPGKCYVALPEDATEGWFVQGGSIKLAKGVCAKVGASVTLAYASGVCHAPSAADSPCETTGADAGAPAPLGAPGAIVSAGSQPYSVGYAESTHLVHAVHDGRYWLFYVDDPTAGIKAMASSDLAKWSAAGTLAIPVDDGNNFSVAYADLGGTDVIHLVANSQSMGGTLHVRSTLAGGALSAGTPLMLQGSSTPGCSNDAPSVAVMPDGTIYDATGWLAHSCCVCDTNLFTSLAPDRGGAGWTPGFAYDAYYVSVPSYAYSHELVALPDAGTALALWPDEDNTNPTLFDSVDYALSTDFPLHDGGSVAPANNGADEVFSSATSPQQMSWDDWSTCRLTDGDVHLLRHVLEPGDAQNLVGAFEEARWNGASWSIASSPPAAVESPSNSGLALASGPDPTRGFLLATIGTDSAIHIAKWTATGGWSQVATVKRSMPPRAIASGGCGSPRPYFLWTEGTSTYTLMGLDVTSLL